MNKDENIYGDSCTTDIDIPETGLAHKTGCSKVFNTGFIYLYGQTQDFVKGSVGVVTSAAVVAASLVPASCPPLVQTNDAMGAASGTFYFLLCAQCR